MIKSHSEAYKNIKVKEINKINYLKIKPILDFIAAIILIVLLSPLLFILAILVRITSHGKVVFKQNRVGKDGEIFECYKFRSMHSNADQEKYLEFIKKAHAEEYGFGVARDHVEFKTNDYRLTGIGKIIRKLSLDELLQLFNVLKGDMSLIGPRPDVPESVELYTEFERKRLKVKPGISGWWQVNGRSNLTLSQMFELDNYYIDNISFRLDLIIFIKTIYTVLTMKGAG